jgi:preprotein translocase subunit SecF
MEFTRTQTSIIVLEIVFIFIGVVAIFRIEKMKKSMDFYSPSTVSTSAVSGVYLPPTDELFKKIYSKANKEKTFTVELETTRKKTGTVSTVNLYEKEQTGGKKKKPKKESDVITIDLSEEGGKK